MTTVVFQGDTMASDSTCTTDGAHVASVRKVYRVGRWLVGFAGSTCLVRHTVELMTPMLRQDDVLPGAICDLSAYVEAVDNGQGNHDELEALLAHPEHGVWIGELTGKGWLVCQHVQPHPWGHAIGSGALPALVALEYGATIRQAIATAARYDSGTGGKVQLERFR
jgi:ATP-dependent protease HslVU (ClpYQ) peptidase subunit